MLLSRLQITVNRLALKVLRFPKPLVLAGNGSAAGLCAQMAQTGTRRVLVVTDRALLQTGLVQPLLDALAASGVQTQVFSEVEPDPCEQTVMAAVQQLQDSRADAVLAVGGGSCMDCAKAVVHCHANAATPARLAGIWLYAWPRKQGLALYAIPTTAGTGSEVTIAAVITDRAAQVKRSLIDPKLVPVMVALDPGLMRSLPPPLTAATGMDALTHAVEAFVSTLADAESDLHARAAAAGIVQWLPVAWANGGDLDARLHMAVASCRAGLAFTRAGVGYVHAFAHQLGALYHLPHGLANAIVLPHVLAFCKPRASARLAELARLCGLCGLSGAHGGDEAQQAEAFIGHVRAMNQRMGIASTVDALRPQDFARIISQAFDEAHGRYGVPRYMNAQQARALLTALLPDAASAPPRADSMADDGTAGRVI